MTPFKTVSSVIDTRSQSILWHGMEVNQAIPVFEDNELKAYSKHRFWSDGRVRHDRMPDYETSNWFCGWCMSRSFEISKNFGQIVFAFDRNILKQNMRTIPLTYGRTIQGGPKNHKKELEEFVTNGTFIRSVDLMEKEYDKEMDIVFDLEDDIRGQEKPDPEIVERIKKAYSAKTPMDFWMDHHGKALPVSKSIGFFVDKKSATANPLSYEDILNHPKFIGFF